MKLSFTYYLTLLVIKLKGLKKNFSEDPINYQKIRKEDVFKPKGIFFKKHISKIFKIENSEITEINVNRDSNKLLIFIHGGAFIAGPGQHHWDAVKQIAKQTNYTIWLCNYPKAPEHNIVEISKNIDTIYNYALANFDANSIALIGDSVGGTLVTALNQRLITTNKKLPNKIILICPVMDASMSNPEIKKIDQLDPILSKKGILSAKKMCAAKIDLKDKMISALYGSFINFPETILFIAEHDIMYPDQKLLVEKLKKANVKYTIINGEKMPHIWPYLPVMKEAKTALSNVFKVLNKS